MTNLTRIRLNRVDWSTLRNSATHNLSPSLLGRDGMVIDVLLAVPNGLGKDRGGDVGEGDPALCAVVLDHVLDALRRQGHCGVHLKHVSVGAQQDDLLVRGHRRTLESKEEAIAVGEGDGNPSEGFERTNEGN